MPDLVDELVDQDILGMQMVRIWVFIPPVRGGLCGVDMYTSHHVRFPNRVS
jgi:hypothetical protein